MANQARTAVVPPRLQSGDRVRLVSPASTPTREGVGQCAHILESWGFKVEIGQHAFDSYGYLAGKDEDRLADINDALRDRGVRAIFATRGGKGAYRIADGLDFEAARANPKLLVGFSETTILHLALWKNCALAGIHGGIASWNASQAGAELREALRRSLMTSESVHLTSNQGELTAQLTTTGKATGYLMGGNLDMIATASGWALPELDGAIVLLEAIEMGLGHVDRQLTMLSRSGCLRGVKGIAVGQFTKFGEASGWTVIDVLRDRLSGLGVPILGGLPLGHDMNSRVVPLGTNAVLDVDAGTLTVGAAVK